MKRFVFPQQPLLNLKRQQQKQQQMVVSAWLQRVHACERQIQELQEQIERQFNLLDTSSTTEVPRRLASIERMQRRLTSHTLQLTELMKELQRQQDLLNELSIEVETFQTLKSHRWDEYKKQLERHRQNELDELVQQRILRTSRQMGRVSE